MLYDPLGRCVKITETTAGSVTSTKQFVWCGNERCEERDGSGSLSNGKQFYGLGQVNYASGTPTNYFYNLDHLGSVREMTKTVSSTTTIEAQYAYGAWGEVTKLAGSADSDFQYAGYYKHARSGLDLTLYRAYSAGQGRWLSRDPLGESAGVNLYGYVGGNPVRFTDPYGLQEATMAGTVIWPGPGTILGGAIDIAIIGGGIWGAWQAGQLLGGRANQMQLPTGDSAPHNVEAFNEAVKFNENCKDVKNRCKEEHGCDTPEYHACVREAGCSGWMTYVTKIGEALTPFKNYLIKPGSHKEWY